MRDNGWQELAYGQAGMLSRRQLLALGVDRNVVRNQVAAGRWVLRTPLVVSTTTGALTFAQQVWLGVLHAGPGCAVGGLTATRIRGLKGWDRDTVTILVDEAADVSPAPGVQFVRTRRDIAEMLAPGRGAPVCRVEPAALLFGGYTRSQRTACGLLAALVQQRLTTADRLAEWVERMRPLRRARMFRTTLADIGSGAQSLAEIDVGAVCRRFNLPRPDRQVRRRDRDGRLRFTDCEWRLRDGRRVVLEVDGAFHMDVGSWESDITRERGLVVDGAIVLRCTSSELRHSPERVVRDLIALGITSRGCERAV